MGRFRIGQVALCCRTPAGFHGSRRRHRRGRLRRIVAEQQPADKNYSQYSEHDRPDNFASILRAGFQLRTFPVSLQLHLQPYRTVLLSAERYAIDDEEHPVALQTINEAY